jgi:glycosyltransferase involved in cell wall biosynthesis
MMRISLVTICWNAERTLRRAVSSVLAQTRLPEEYAFVDGGSTDGTLELLSELCASLGERGVKAWVIPQKRNPGEEGIPSAWNQGIAQVTGDVIGLLNSDDWYEPHALATFEKTFAEHDDAGLVSAPVRFVSPGTGKEIKVFRKVPSWQLAFRMTVPHPGLFVRKRTYELVGLYDTEYRISADYDFVWRCKNAGVTMAAIDEPLVNMELGGTANRSRAKARRETLQIARKHGRWWLLPWVAWLMRTLTGR